MSITDIYLKANRTFEKFEKAVAVLIITSIVIIVFAGTVARYIFKEPIFGSDRLATYLMVWLGFIGFSIATSKLRHIEIEFLKAKVKANLRYLLNIISSLLASLFLIIMVIISLGYIKESKELGDVDIALNIPLWIIISIIPITFVISAIRFFFSAFLWLDVLKGKRLESEFIQKQLV
jgi:TRAP-type transport system small permease protein